MIIRYEIGPFSFAMMRIMHAIQFRKAYAILRSYKGLGGLILHVFINLLGSIPPFCKSLLWNAVYPTLSFTWGTLGGWKTFGLTTSVGEN